MATYTGTITRENGSVNIRFEVPKRTQHERLRYEHQLERELDYRDAVIDVRNRYGSLVGNY